MKKCYTLFPSKIVYVFLCQTKKKERQFYAKKTHLVYKVFDYTLATWLDFLYYYYYTINYDDDLVSHAFERVAPRCYRLESILFPVNTYHCRGGWNLCHVGIVDVPNENPDDITLMDTLSILLIQTPQLHTHNRLSKIRKPRKMLIVTLKHCNTTMAYKAKYN